MGKAVFIVFVVAVIIVSFLFFNSQIPRNNTQKATTPTEIQKQEENVVLYTDSGFSPKTLSIESGATVVFKNGSNKSMWVASDPHPLHTGFPEFNQNADGDLHEFIFHEIGSYPYHNHLFPKETGTIVVK